MKPQINISDFTKLDLRVGKIIDAIDVTGSQKLVEMKVDLGSEIGTKTIYAGIKAWYAPENLVGRKLIFVVNLEPKRFKIGDQELVSEGMLLAAGGGEAVLYQFDKDLDIGTILR